MKITYVIMENKTDKCDECKQASTFYCDFCGYFKDKYCCYKCEECEERYHVCENCEEKHKCRCGVMSCNICTRECDQCGIKECDSCFKGVSCECDSCFDSFTEHSQIYCGKCYDQYIFSCYSTEHLRVGCDYPMYKKECGHYCCEDCNNDDYKNCPDCVKYIESNYNKLFLLFLSQNTKLPIDLLKIIQSYLNKL